MFIEIIAPHDGGARVSVSGIPDNANRVYLELVEKDNETSKITIDYPIGKTNVDIQGLINNRQYLISAKADDNEGNITDVSGIRILTPNYIPGNCVAYINPFDSSFDPAGRYFGSPSVVKLDNGDIIVSHDVFFESYPNQFGIDFRDRPAKETCITKVYKSSDNGVTWEFLTDVKCCTFAKLFVFKGKLYMVALSSDEDAILNDPYNVEERNNDKLAVQNGIDIKLFCSEDGGRTFGKPCNITKGMSAGSFHKAATPVVECGGRLWTAFDTPKHPESGFGMGVASVDINADIMDENNWVVSSPFLHYDKNWPNTVDGVWPYMLEEANAVVGPDNEVYVIARYNSVNYCAEFIKAEDDGLRVAVMKADKNNPSAPLEFVEMRHFIGSLAKFTINYDDISKKYYSLVSRATSNMCCQRNILTLVSSADLIKWKIERDCVNIQDLNWYQNCQCAGLYYCDWVFDGDDIIAVCRSAVHDCINYHNSNMITFHRFVNIRNKNYDFND